MCLCFYYLSTKATFRQLDHFISPSERTRRYPSLPSTLIPQNANKKFISQTLTEEVQKPGNTKCDIESTEHFIIERISGLLTVSVFLKVDDDVSEKPAA